MKKWCRKTEIDIKKVIGEFKIPYIILFYKKSLINIIYINNSINWRFYYTTFFLCEGPKFCFASQSMKSVNVYSNNLIILTPIFYLKVTTMICHYETFTLRLQIKNEVWNIRYIMHKKISTFNKKKIKQYYVVDNKITLCTVKMITFKLRKSLKEYFSIQLVT